MFFLRFGVVLAQKVVPRLHLWRLLLLGGDVEPNMGLVRFGVCGVVCTSRGPQCGRCIGWTHLGRSGLRRDVLYGIGGREEGWRSRCCVGEDKAVEGDGGGGWGAEPCGACGVRL